MKAPVNIIEKINDKETLRTFLLEIVSELNRKDIYVEWHTEKNGGIIEDENPRYEPEHIELDFSHYDKSLYERFKRER